MGTITLPNNPGTIQNAQVTNATKVMENFTAIVNECNGNLSAANLAALAVETAKIAELAVTAAKIAANTITEAKIAIGHGFNITFDGNATAPAGVYNGSGDAKVQVKEAIDTLPTSGTLEIHGDEYAYTSLDTTNKAFNLSGTLSRDYVEDDAVYVQTTIRNLKLSGKFDNLDRVKDGTDFGRNIIFDGNAALPAGAYNGTGDAIVRVKESIDNLPTSGTLEIAGDEYAYTTVTVGDKEFNLSGTLSKDYSEDDAVYIQTVIRNTTVTGNATVTGDLIADQGIDKIKDGTDFGRNIIFDGNAALPAGAYNGTGDAIVRVKESIDNLPTSGTLEIAGDEYAYTTVTVGDKEFNLSGTLSKDYSEDDAVYIQTVIRNLKLSGELNADGKIGLAHLATDAVDGSKIADDSINSEHYVAGSIDLEHLSADSIDSNQYVDGSIDAEHLSTACRVPGVKDHQGVLGGLICRAYALGNVAMSSSMSYAHGLGEAEKLLIMSVDVILLRDDAYQEKWCNGFSGLSTDVNSQSIIVDNTNIVLSPNMNYYTGAQWDNTNVNRGYIIVWIAA